MVLKNQMWITVVLSGPAAAAHQDGSANLFTTVSDMFPRKAVCSVVGLGGTAGAVGGIILSTLASFLLEFTGSYIPFFIIAGSAYLIALLVFNLLVPKMEPVDVLRHQREETNTPSPS